MDYEKMEGLNENQGEQQQRPLILETDVEEDENNRSIPNSINNDNSNNSISGDSRGIQQPNSMYTKLLPTYILYSIIVGYTVSTQPSGAGWRYFSWHPFLMITGFVSMMGAAAITKKLGGYTNTKIHGMVASGGLVMAFCGLYVIYHNKELMGKDHITTTHAVFGIITMAGCVMAMLAGGVFLHPDFGVDKTNKNIRFAHKWFARSIMLFSWVTCFLGLNNLTNDKSILLLFVLPLLVLAPFTLI